jgi:exodeoxyribonuclease VII large subunit
VPAEQPRLIDEPTLSVAELCAGIGRVLGRAYPEPLWVRGEVANKHSSAHGHVFFDLLDPDGAAGIRVVLWRGDRQVVNAILRRGGHAVRIDDGTEVRIRVEVGWHPSKGTVRLRMLAIDTAYTLGRLAEDRERLIRTLEDEGVLARQAALELEPVPLRVGLVTSARSAAAADFLHTLEASGFAWQVLVGDARMQGAEAEASVAARLRSLAPMVDVVCVVRGGGARTDLAAFDREALARAVAACPVPVLTGIGHETDTTVADLAAWRAFKTPTACAAFLVERVGAHLDAVEQAWSRIERRAVVALERSEERLLRAAGRAEGACRHHLRARAAAMEMAARRLAARAPRIVDQAERSIRHAESRLAALDPARLLARGWTITRHADGRLVRTATEVAPDNLIDTTFADGIVRSRVGG